MAAEVKLRHEIYPTTPAAARLVTSNPEDNEEEEDDDDIRKIKVSHASCLLIEHQRNGFCFIQSTSQTIGGCSPSYAIVVVVSVVAFFFFSFAAAPRGSRTVCGVSPSCVSRPPPLCENKIANPSRNGDNRGTFDGSMTPTISRMKLITI